MSQDRPTSTTTGGAPVADKQNSQSAGPRGQGLSARSARGGGRPEKSGAGASGTTPAPENTHRH